MIDDWNKLPYGKHLALLRIWANEDTDEGRRWLATYATLSGMTEREIFTMPLRDLERIKAGASFIFDPIPEAPVRKSYDVAGFCLEPVRDIMAMTAGQFVDFQEYGKIDGEHSVELLSTMLVPRGCKYGIEKGEPRGYDITEVQAAIRELPTPDAKALLAFFLNLCAASLQGILRYSAREIRRTLQMIRRKERRESRRHSRTNGRGLSALTSSRKRVA